MMRDTRREKRSQVLHEQHQMCIRDSVTTLPDGFARLSGLLRRTAFSHHEREHRLRFFFSLNRQAETIRQKIPQHVPQRDFGSRRGRFGDDIEGISAVSYTHLDVYKRQATNLLIRQ